MNVPEIVLIAVTAQVLLLAILLGKLFRGYLSAM